MRLIRSLVTHTHADHLSGHGRLALEHGVPVSIHPAAEAEYAHEPLEDGTEIEVGQVLVRVLHTPGHRPEHVCFAVADRSRGSAPWLVLTGDSLFVGDAARPDLAVGAKEGAEDLFRSLQRLLELADGIEVFPGHVAGSLCGKGMSSKASSTIGYERLFNPALQIEQPGPVRVGRGRCDDPQAPEHEPNRRAQPRAVRGRTAGRGGVGGADRLDPARRPADRRLPRGTSSRSRERARLRQLVRDEGRVRARPGGAGGRPGCELRGGRAGDPRPLVRRLSRCRRLRARWGLRTDGGREPRRARGAPLPWSRADRRARARRAGYRLHRRKPQHPLPPALGLRSGRDHGSTGGDDLRVGSEGRRRSVDPGRAGRRRAPGARRRRRGLGRTRRPHRRVPPLRELSAGARPRSRAREAPAPARRSGLRHGSRGSTPPRSGRSAAPSPLGGARPRRHSRAPRQRARGA